MYSLPQMLSLLLFRTVVIGQQKTALHLSFHHHLLAVFRAETNFYIYFLASVSEISKDVFFASDAFPSSV